MYSPHVSHLCHDKPEDVVICLLCDIMRYKSQNHVGFNERQIVKYLPHVEWGHDTDVELAILRSLQLWDFEGVEIWRVVFL